MEPIELLQAVPTIRGPWVEVDLAALEENIRTVQGALGDGPQPVFVLKANAYGHGIVPLARKAASCGVTWFAVAYLHEARFIRAALPDVNILVMGVIPATDVATLIEERIIPVVVSEEHGLDLGQAAAALQATLPVHLKIDTGMARLGIDWQVAVEVLGRLLQVPGLDIQGLCSHFATVEPDQPKVSRLQHERFQAVVDAHPRPFFKHFSSSRSFLLRPEWDFDAVRLGIVLYGYGASDPHLRVETTPILQWKTVVMQVKEVAARQSVGYYGTYVTPTATRLATIACGYADGYLRTLSNRGHVLIRGRRHRVVGRVTMNWITIDVGIDSDVRAGDEVVLVGRQGEEAIWADELASQCRTIPYEILTGIRTPQQDVRYLSA